MSAVDPAARCPAAWQLESSHRCRNQRDRLVPRQRYGAGWISVTERSHLLDAHLPRNPSRRVRAGPRRLGQTATKDLAIPAREAIMMPSTTPAAGEAAAASGGHGYGFVLVAFILVFVTGFYNMIEGIAAIANSRVFIAHAHFIFANLTLVFA